MPLRVRTRRDKTGCSRAAQPLRPRHVPRRVEAKLSDIAPSGPPPPPFHASPLPTRPDRRGAGGRPLSAARTPCCILTPDSEYSSDLCGEWGRRAGRLLAFSQGADYPSHNLCRVHAAKMPQKYAKSSRHSGPREAMRRPRCATRARQGLQGSGGGALISFTAFLLSCFRRRRRRRRQGLLRPVRGADSGAGSCHVYTHINTCPSVP